MKNTHSERQREGMYGIIYRASNKANGKVYIGQTTLSLRKRMQTHMSAQKARDTYFKSSLKKYGIDGFVWEEIDSADTQEELNRKECYWIQFHDSTDRRKGYNTNPGGRNYGRMPDCVRQKISKTRMGYPGTMNGVRHTPEAIEKIRQSKIGKKRKPPSFMARVHMSEARKGKRFTAEHSAKIAEATRGKPKPWHRVAVMNVTTGKVYNSIQDAAADTGLLATSISRCIKGKAKTVGGFHWVHFRKAELEAEQKEKEAMVS